MNMPRITVPPPAPPAPSAPEGMTMIQNVSLEAFEHAVYTRNHEAAGQLLLDMLRRLKTGAEFIGYAVGIPQVKIPLYTRFCAAVITLLADPGFTLAKEGFDFIAAEHAVMDLMFRASAFQNSDHLLPQLSDTPTEPDRNKIKLSSGPNLAKFLLTYSLRSGFNLNFADVFGSNKTMVFSLWVGMLSALLRVHPQAQARCEELLGLHRIFADVDIPDSTLPSLSDAYMYASYGLRRDKHDMKGTIHEMFSRLLVQRGVPVPSSEAIYTRRRHALEAHALGIKPKILVCIEWFTSLHAMFRCYAPIIRQLRTKFHLVAMCRPSDIDELGKAEFDEWYPVHQERLVMAEIAGKVNEIAPDIILHPSLGMALWWTVLASVRLAPIQMMMLGHPSSSRSPCMDYLLCDEGAIGDPSLYSERIVEYPNGSARFVMRHDADFPEPVTLSNDTIHIAVPAMLCKLNATFLETLQKIQNKVKRPLIFHFFVNMIGINLFQTASEIREWLPTSRIYERNQYSGYIKHLSECHLHCSTFPFGGTNSNIDSMKLGIPIITMWGDEPHSRYDGMMLRRADMPEYLIAKTTDEYVDVTVELVHNDAKRDALRDQLRTTDLESIFFGDPPERDRTAIVDLIEDLFVNHEDRIK